MDTYETAIEQLKVNGRYLKYIEDPTYEMCEIAIEQNPNSIRDITPTTKTFSWPPRGEWIPKPEENITAYNYICLCKQALAVDPLLIRFIPVAFTHPLISDAFALDERVLLYVKIPYDMYQWHWPNGMVMNNGVQQPHVDDKFGDIKDIEVARKIFFSDVAYGRSARRMDNLFGGIFSQELNQRSEKSKIRYLRVSRQNSVIGFFKNQTEEMKWTALKSQPHSIRDIENPTREMIMYSIINKPFSSKDWNNFVADDDIELQKIAIREHPLYLSYLKHAPSDEVLDIALTLPSKHISDAMHKGIFTEDQITRILAKHPALVNSIYDPSQYIIDNYFDSEHLKLGSAKIYHTHRPWGAISFYKQTNDVSIKMYLCMKFGITDED